MENYEPLLILNATPGIGNAKIKQLVEFFGNAQKVLEANEDGLLFSGVVNAMTAKNILAVKDSEFLNNEIMLIKNNKVKIVTFWDNDYPAVLKEIPDAPVVLYIKGHIKNDEKLSMSIVGSRRASVYGTMLANQFAVKLGELGFTIVSGMASGIDTAAHKGAILAKANTIAVLGNGFLNVYPSENKKLFDEICVKGGVVSEFPMKMPPMAVNFPRRNRVISGLSLGTIVVEAAQRSGSLITARYALEQGREVYAVPGKIDSPTSKGVNNLIKQGAKLMTGIEDVLEDLDMQIKEILKPQCHKTIRSQAIDKTNFQKELLNDLTEQELLVYKYMNNNYYYLDDIIYKTNLNPEIVSSVLMRLELKGLVKQKSGKRYSKSNVA